MNLVSIPANPVPDGASGDAQDAATASCCALPACAPPPGRKGTVCMFQGRAEFIEKYFETVRDLRARGFAVATLDWRGQGRSRARAANRPQGPCARLRRIQTATSKPSCKEVVLPDCPPPLSRSRHSMGASVLIARGPARAALVRPHRAARRR